MAQLIQVSKQQVKKCDRCGTLIAFHTNRNGKKYPVEVYHHPGLGMVYRAHYGAYNNMTMWHQCDLVLERQEEFEKSRKEEELKRRKDEVARQYLPRLMEMAQNYDESKRAEAEALGAEYAAALTTAEAEVK